jgi:hypothetical protein
MIMKAIITYLLISCLLILLSCSKNKNQKDVYIKNSYIDFANSGHEIIKSDSLPYNEGWKQDSILDSIDLFINKKRYTILKISNYPNDPIDGGHVAYYEKSLGIFYYKSTTWRSFILLRTNNDSVNYYIDLFLGSVLSTSHMFLNPRQSEILDK